MLRLTITILYDIFYLIRFYFCNKIQNKTLIKNVY